MAGTYGDSNNYIAQAPDGTYTVVVNGQTMASGVTSWSQAQSLYSSSYGPPPSSTSTSGSTSTDKVTSDAQALVDAIASGNTQDFNEKVREFNADLAEKQREYNLGYGVDYGKNAGDFAQGNNNTYSNLALGLLDAATKLKGPADYFQYEKALQGGRDIYNNIYGNQPKPAFEQASPFAPASLSDILSQLGISGLPSNPLDVYQQSVNNANTATGEKTIQPYTPPPSGGSTTPPVMDTGGVIGGGGGRHILAILQGGERVIPSPYKGQGANPHDTAMVTMAKAAGIPVFDNGGIVSPISGTNDALIPTSSANTYKDPNNAYASGGVTPSANNSSGATPAPYTDPDTYTGAPSINWTQGGPYASPTQAQPTTTTPTDNSNPLTPGVPTLTPSQISPAVWDSYNPSYQQFLLGAAQTQGWDANDFMAQINAQRPSGNAPKSTYTSFATPAGVF